jgi:sterol desaturase/sphingolipid hydroxylase (fatty acid hydroxylase superfamily)
MATILASLLLWTFLMYVMHRLVHITPVLRDWHMDHHREVTYGRVGWHWSNLFLFNDTWTSTLDWWITEVMPTLVTCWLTGQWWLAVAHYLWAAFIQERVEHDPNFDWPVLTSGRWHMVHHVYWMQNYGAFIPLWDLIFGTYATPTRKK